MIALISTFMLSNGSCDPLNQLFDSQSIPSFWKDVLELLQISHHEKKGLSINIIICIMIAITTYLWFYCHVNVAFLQIKLS